jgi:hypothetical protein
MKTPWHYADELYDKEKPDIKDIVEEIQIIAYNQALADVIEKREWLIGDDYRCLAVKIDNIKKLLKEERK